MKNVFFLHLKVLKIQYEKWNQPMHKTYLIYIGIK